MKCLINDRKISSFIIRNGGKKHNMFVNMYCHVTQARPDIAVTLVHSGAAMVEYMKPAFGARAKAFLEAAGVQV